MAEKEKKKQKSKIKKFFKNQYVFLIISIILASILAYFTGFFELPERMISVENQLSELNDKFTSESLVINDLRDRVSTLEGYHEGLKDATKINLSYDASNVLESNNYDTIFSLGKINWKSTDVIARNAENDVEYTAKELVSKKLLIPYTSKHGEEVYFYGQFNENNQWDGNCITNVYKDNKLTLIMDADYKNGKLLNYSQVIPYSTKRNQNSWLFCERVNNGSSHSGNSWSYFYSGDYNKTFNLENVTVNDIMNMKDFESKEMSAKSLESYYHGNTSNGYYNDVTGKAYIVKYFPNGKVRTLYCGNFKDGDFYDTTGNAWEIAKETNTNYMYYKGVFKDKKPPKNKDSTNLLSLKEIKDKIKNKKFDCDLKWDIDN